MFSVNVIDHVRLNLADVVENYGVHARAAERLASLTLKIRIGLVIIFLVAAGAASMSLFLPWRGYPIVAAVSSAAGLIGFVLVVGMGLEARVYAHRTFSHRLWIVCERYRSFLAEIKDGLVDQAAILERREILSQQVHAIHEHGFGADQRAYESLRQGQVAGEGVELTGEKEKTEGDLPASVRKEAPVGPRTEALQH